jgi:hypothetical protein
MIVGISLWQRDPQMSKVVKQLLKLLGNLVKKTVPPAPRNYALQRLIRAQNFARLTSDSGSDVDDEALFEDNVMSMKPF